jgi:hypothetical protein
VILLSCRNALARPGTGAGFLLGWLMRNFAREGALAPSESPLAESPSSRSFIARQFDSFQRM